MTSKRLSDSTRHRMHISRRITDANMRLAAPLLDRLVNLVAAVPGRPGNPHQHVALTAAMELVKRNGTVNESDVIQLETTFTEGTIFLRRKSWLYRNRDKLEDRIRNAGLVLSEEAMSDLVLIVIRSVSKDGHISPHNTLHMLEKTLTVLREYGMTHPFVIAATIDRAASVMGAVGYTNFKLEIDHLEHPERYRGDSMGGC